MNTQTSLVAEQVRLQQWAEQIKECQNRPSDMKVDAWCSAHGIFCGTCQTDSAGFRRSPEPANCCGVAVSGWGYR